MWEVDQDCLWIASWKGCCWDLWWTGILVLSSSDSSSKAPFATENFNFFSPPPKSNTSATGLMLWVFRREFSCPFLKVHSYCYLASSFVRYLLLFAQM